MSEEDIEFLEGGNYISFSTRKKSGDFVATPVWFCLLYTSDAADDDYTV